jgi:hypothetical protein
MPLMRGRPIRLTSFSRMLRFSSVESKDFDRAFSALSQNFNLSLGFESPLEEIEPKCTMRRTRGLRDAEQRYDWQA